MYFLEYFLIKFFIPLSRVEAITFESFVPAKRDPGSVKEGPVLPGWNFLHVIAKCNLWRVYNLAGIPSNRDMQSSPQKPAEIKACVENFYIVFVMPLPMTNSI